MFTDNFDIMLLYIGTKKEGGEKGEDGEKRRDMEKGREGER